MGNPPENQHAVSQKKQAFWEHQFWRSSMMTLSSFVAKFRSCRGKLVKQRQNEKHFVKISVKGLKMTLVCRIWTIWTMSATLTFLGHQLHFLSPEICHQTMNCPSMRYIVAAKISPALPLCRKNWFCGKVLLDDFYSLLLSIASSWIHIGVKRISQACCLHHHRNIVKHNFGMKHKIGHFFGPPCKSTSRYWS